MSTQSATRMYAVERLFERLESALRSGPTCPLLMMTSGGGLTTSETVVRTPIRLIESGHRAGGAILAELAQHLGSANEFLSIWRHDAKICLLMRQRCSHIVLKSTAAIDFERQWITGANTGDRNGELGRRASPSRKVDKLAAS